jgi:hypothetical protein
VRGEDLVDALAVGGLRLAVRVVGAERAALAVRALDLDGERRGRAGRRVRVEHTCRVGFGQSGREFGDVYGQPGLRVGRPRIALFGAVGVEALMRVCGCARAEHRDGGEGDARTDVGEGSFEHVNPPGWMTDVHAGRPAHGVHRCVFIDARHPCSP